VTRTAKPEGQMPQLPAITRRGDEEELVMGCVDNNPELRHAQPLPGFS